MVSFRAGSDSQAESMEQDDAAQWAAPSRAFLGVPTPESWIGWALRNQATLLVDHANCERKAAATALALMQRHIDEPEFVVRLSKLAREELVHFEQVLRLMNTVGVDYRPLSAADYAGRLIAAERRSEPGRKIDRLIVSAIIEARSCERFASLAPHLEEPLRGFYFGLLRSEARHFEIYLRQATRIADQWGESGLLADRQAELVAVDNALITEPSDTFRFHSGVPREAMSAA